MPQRLHEGVVRDLERLERRKENLRLLEEQRTLTSRLEQERRHRGVETDRYRTPQNIQQDSAQRATAGRCVAEYLCYLSRSDGQQQ